MPTYTFRNKDTGEEFEVTMRMSEYDEYKEKHPNHMRVYNSNSAPALVSGVNSQAKIPSGFKDRMKEIKKNHPAGDYGSL
jgi:hypothetical protein